MKKKPAAKKTTKKAAAKTDRIGYHPLANLLPMMSDAELLSLTDDVRANGLREPIVRLDGKILDGRNRYAACIAADSAPRFRDFDPKAEGTPLSYIISKATHRHMSDSQKACSAVGIMEEIEKDAKERIRRHGGTAPGKAAEHTPGTSSGGESRDHAGNLFGVSGRYVQSAKLLKQNAPDLFAKVFDGNEALSRAVREHQRRAKTATLKEKAAAAPKVEHGAGWEIATGDVLAVAAARQAKPRLRFFDPPYNLGFTYGKGVDDARPESEYLEWCAEWLALGASQLADDGSMFVMIDAKHQAWFASEMESMACDLHWRNTIVWHETFGNYTDANFTPCARFIHYFTKHPTRFVFNGGEILIPSDRQEKYGDKRAVSSGKVPGNVWTFPRLVDNSAERMPGFPTQVPLALMERIVLACSEPGDLVEDWFNGSGTTGHAAIKHGRRYFGIDVVPENAEWSRHRLAAAAHDVEKARKA